MKGRGAMKKQIKILYSVLSLLYVTILGSLEITAMSAVDANKAKHNVQVKKQELKKAQKALQDAKKNQPVDHDAVITKAKGKIAKIKENLRKAKSNKNQVAMKKAQEALKTAQDELQKAQDAKKITKQSSSGLNLQDSQVTQSLNYDAVIAKAKEKIAKIKENLKKAKSNKNQVAIQKTQEALKKAQDELHKAQDTKKTAKQAVLTQTSKTVDMALVAAVDASSPVASTPAVVVPTEPVLPSEQDIKMLEGMIQDKVHEAVIKEGDKLWPRREHKKREEIKEILPVSQNTPPPAATSVTPTPVAAVPVPSPSTSTASTPTPAVTTPTPTPAPVPQGIKDTVKSIDELPSGTLVALYSVKDDKFFALDDKFLKATQTEDQVKTNKAAQFKIIRNGTALGFERSDGTPNHLQCEPNAKIIWFANTNFSITEQFTLEFDAGSDVVYIKSNAVNGYLNNLPDKNNRLYAVDNSGALAVKNPSAQFKIKVVSAAPPVVVKNPAINLAALEQGTVVALLSVKDNKYLGLDGGKYLKPSVLDDLVKTQEGANFAITRDGDNVGFMYSNKYLQCVLGDNVAQFEKDSFGDWEKFTLEFDKDDVVYIKNITTGGYLTSLDSKDKRVYTCDASGAQTTKNEQTKFKIRIIKAAPIKLVTSLGDIPEGTVVGLLSVSEGLCAAVDDKFLKPAVKLEDLVKTQIAQFTIRRQGDFVAFERTETNRNRLQAVPQENVVRFENGNFGDWEKFTIDFDDNGFAYINSDLTKGYLNCLSERSNRLYTSDVSGKQMGKEDKTKFKVYVVNNTSMDIPPNLRASYSRWVPTFKLPEPGSGSVSFVANMSNDLHIAFSPNMAVADPMYEVVIGGWGNTKSVIRKKSQGPEVVSVQSGLDVDMIIVPVQGPFGAVIPTKKIVPKETKFTITLDKAAKKLIILKGNTLLMEYKDSAFLDKVNYFTFSSWDNPGKVLDVVSKPLQP